MHSLRQRMLIVVLLAIAEFCGLLAAVVDRNLAMVISEILGLGIAFGVALIFIMDHHAIVRQRQLTEINAANLVIVSQRMHEIERKLHDRQSDNNLE